MCLLPPSPPVVVLSRIQVSKKCSVPASAHFLLREESIFACKLLQKFRKNAEHHVSSSDVGERIDAGSRFFFTFNEASEFMQAGVKDFMYPASFFDSLAEKYRFKLANCSIEYGHPRGQKMVRLSKLSPDY